MKILRVILFLSFSSNAVAASWDNIFEAAMHGKGKDVEVFLKKGVSIELKDEDGSTPLIVAALVNNIDTVSYLIKKGANVNAQDNDKGSALMGACISDQKKLAKLLIDSGADASLENIDGASSKDLCELLSPQIYELIENQP